MSIVNPHVYQLGNPAWRRLERVVQEFESALEKGERPTLDPYLRDNDTVRQALLIELLHLDVEYRLRAGEAPRVEEYLLKYPEVAGDAELAAELIAADYRWRRAREADITPAEYLARFPEYSTQLHEKLSNVDASLLVALEKPPHAHGPETLPSVPGYEMISVLGRGGMGVVYKARQTQLRRLVALKMLRSGADVDENERLRFRTEAESAARLQHPNIVQIYEVGEAAGRPYLALEYVEGQNLAERLAVGLPTPDSAAELVETLAHAVHFAHERGVVHRDLKPANILLQNAECRLQNAESGQMPGLKSEISNLQSAIPKIADFGLAKQLDSDEHTRSGAILGTPSYMAPEQARGASGSIGPATDVYSLGAIIYEMLTGRPPFRAPTVLETLERVRGDEPAPPGRLQSGLPRDLETICLKCLDKLPGRRYASAGALADDLHRFLAGKPILARRTRAWERVVKWARRQPAAAGLITLAVAAVVALAAFTLWYQSYLQAAAGKLALDELAVRQGLEQARANHEELQSVLKRPGGVQGLLNQPGRWEAQIKTARLEWQRAQALAAHAGDALDAVLLEGLQRTGHDLTTDESDHELAQSLEKIRFDKATWVEGTFDYELSMREYAQAFQEAGCAIVQGAEEQAAEIIKRSAIKEQLLAALDDWAWSAHETKNPVLANQLLLVTRLADPEPWRDKLGNAESWLSRSAMAKLADEIQNDRSLVSRLSPERLLLVSRLLPRSHAEAWLRQAQALHPANFWLNFELAAELKAKQEILESIGFYRVAVAIRPTNPVVYNNLGNAMLRHKDTAGAIDAFRKALAILPSYAFAWNNLANALAAGKDLRGAIDAYRRALAIYPNYAFGWNNLGLALTTTREFAAAVDAFNKSLALDAGNPKIWYNLGVALREQKDLPGAVRAFKKALAIDPQYGDAWNILGLTLRAQKDYAGAVEALNKALDINPRSAFAWANLGNALRSKRDLSAAVSAYRKAVAIEPRLAGAWCDLGGTQVDQKDYMAAIASYGKAIALYDREPRYWYGRGQAHALSGKLAEAASDFTRVIELDPKHVAAWSDRGGIYEHRGEYDRALVDYSKAIELEPGNSTHLRRRAVLFDKLGRPGQARADLAKAAELGGSDKKDAESPMAK